MKDMLLKLLKPYGATGHEEPIAQVIRETARPLVDEVETDALGNVICVKTGRAGARRGGARACAPRICGGPWCSRKCWISPLAAEGA